MVVLFRPFRIRGLQRRVFERRQQKETTSGRVEPSCKSTDELRVALGACTCTRSFVRMQCTRPDVHGMLMRCDKAHVLGTTPNPRGAAGRRLWLLRHRVPIGCRGAIAASPVRSNRQRAETWRQAGSKTGSPEMRCCSLSASFALAMDLLLPGCAAADTAWTAWTKPKQREGASY